MYALFRLSRAGILALSVLIAGLPRTSDAGPGGSDSYGSATLAEVRDRGYLQCGIARGGIGVSEMDADGIWQGFFPDFCRVLAAAVFGDAQALDFIEVDRVIRFGALQAGAFDVLMANTTWTVTRDAGLGLTFTGTLYYDGQGFLAHKTLGAESLAEVQSATVCVHDATTTIRNLRDLVRTRKPALQVRAFQSFEGAYTAFFGRECDLLTHDRVSLVAQRLNRASDPGSFILFPDVISKEPLGPVVRQNDPAWADLVRWAVFATIIAEEHGVTRDSVDNDLTSDSPEVRRLLGTAGNIGTSLGLASDWAQQIIAQVGNYGEIFHRNLGEGSPVGLERGLNDLWTRGGLIFAPPMR